jgi:hypothetical protein
MHRSLASLIVMCFLLVTAFHAFAQEGSALPDGVVYIKLPPGQVRIEEVSRNGSSSTE